MSITVGIPIYNAAPYLADAIRSVFAQTYQDWELILVDDGSKDASLEIAKSVSDPRVRVISDGQNRRLPYRLNQIVAEAKYDYIARMDADDLISPYRLERQLKILSENPDIDIVSTGVCSLTNDDVPVGMRLYNNKPELTLKDMLLGQSGVVHASVLARKSWFERNRYDETQQLTEDYELWVRAFLKRDFNIWLLAEPLYYYREEGNVTAAKILRAYTSQREVLRKQLVGHISQFDLIKILFTWYMKSFVVKGLSSVNMLGLLYQNRSKLTLNQDMLGSFKQEILLIKNTKVLGLD